MNGLAVCAGTGGFELGVGLVVPNYRTVCYVEREAFAASRLVARMAEGVLDSAPVWDDLLTFDGRRWRGRVDCLTAGFPCQPWSAAGKGAGIEDERWIWPYIRDVIREVEPRLVWLENVPPLISRGGLALVLRDLAGLRFDAEWLPVRAADVGASHERKRVFILAYRDGERFAEFGAALDDDRRDAPGHDVDRRDPRVAYASRDRRQSADGTPAESGWQGRARVDGDGGTLADSERAERRPIEQHVELLGGRAKAADGSRRRLEAMGDAASGGRRELRQSPGRERLTDGEIENVVDAASGVQRDRCESAVAVCRRGINEQAESRGSSARDVEDAARVCEHGPVRTDGRRRRGVSQTGDGVADTGGAGLQRREQQRPLGEWDGPQAPRSVTELRGASVADTGRDAVRVEPERDQRERRLERATEREHTEPRTAVALFPPPPSDSDSWRDVLRERFDLAPALTASDEDRLRIDEAAAALEAAIESPIRRVAHGTADRVDRLRACGNGVVPLAAAYALVTLAARVRNRQAN